MIQTRRRRGAPLAFLGVVFGSWIAARALTWHEIDASEAAATAPTDVEATLPKPEPVRRDGATLDAARFMHASPVSGGRLSTPPHPRGLARARAAADKGVVMSVWQGAPASTALVGPSSARSLTVPAVPSSRPMRAPAHRSSRWSADAWLLLRAGDPGLFGAGFATPAYGGSQAGGVIRYRLAPDSAHRPALYLRAAGAAIGGGEREAALGLSVRPLPRAPVAVLGEARLTLGDGIVQVRPALTLVSELPALQLPAKIVVEAYGQAGWVGGSGATGFADGQIRATRALVKRGETRLALGAGAWAGAQRGAARLDLGPTAVLAVPAGAGSVRLAADWRFRLAGNAAPGSGPVVTISAGF